MRLWCPLMGVILACAQAVIPYGGTDGVGQVLVGEALAVKRQNAADGAVGLVDVAVVAVSDADLSVPAAAFVDFRRGIVRSGARVSSGMSAAWARANALRASRFWLSSV